MKFDKRFLIFFLIICIISNSYIFSQYSPNDSTLVRTTFLREFDKDTIYNYLLSKEDSKVNAALLGIAHSEDTSFVDSIIKLDFNKYNNLISFALGQLGKSKKSEQFLIRKLMDSTNNSTTPIFEAIGKVGDSLTLEYLFNLIEDSNINSLAFPLAISDFYTRGIENNKTDEYLNNNLKLNLTDDQLFFTLFTLYRIGTSRDIAPDIANILQSNNDERIILYSLSNLRKKKLFPNNIDLLETLSKNKSWRIRTELANSACYFPFSSFMQIETYLTLLNDKNPNVSRTSAIALKNIECKTELTQLKNRIEILLTDSTLTKNSKTELLISYTTLFEIDSEQIIDEYSDIVEQKYIYRMLLENPNSLEFKYNYLNSKLSESTEIELLDLLPAYLALQKRYLNDKEYATNLFTVLNSNMSSSVSIVADGLELPMIYQNKEILQELILNQIFENKNNPQFAETIISLANLSFKIDSNFHNSVIDLLSKSSLYSIKKYAFEKLGITNIIPKDEVLFKSLWIAAFKYKFAEVVTNKGKFTIQLKPEFAPLTCGNFISLAESGYYDGVVFHRVVPNFVIQTGDTTNTGWGGPDYEIISEFSPLPFEQGAVGMASIGKDTEGSQWFVMHSLFPHLNGRYSNWGNISEGMDVVDFIDEGDSVITIKLLY